MLLSLLLKLLHSKKVLFGNFIFIFIASLLTSYAFALVTPDPVRVLGIRPRWCPDLVGDQYELTDDEANSLTNICGQVFDSENEQFMAGLTIAVYELDPDLPTGHYEGRPNGLYASTYTDGAGRFHITARKVLSSVKNNVKTSPLRLYVVLRCNNDTLASTIVKSFFDIYNLDHMPYVPTGKTCNYTPPPSEIHVANRGTLLNADVGETGYLDDLPVGSTMEQDLVYNNLTGEEVHDIRYARYHLRLNIGLLSTGLQSRGGMYERDCLHRYEDPYFCNFNDAMYGGDPGSADYLTRAAFRFLPRLCEDTTDRRFEFRGNMVRTNQDPLITARTYNSLFGSSLDSKDYILTLWGEGDEGEETLVDCDCFLAANSVEPGAELKAKCPERNNLLSGGPVSKLGGPFDFTPPVPGHDYGFSYVQNRPMDIPICQLNGRKITASEIMNCATNDTLCPDGITRGHYHPSLSPLLYVGDSYIGYSSYMHFDSKPGRYPRRESEFQIQTTAEQDQYNTGQAIPQEDAGYNARIQGTNAPGSTMVMASPEIVQIHSNPNVTFADVLTGPFTPPDDYIEPESVQAVYFEYMVTPYAKTSLGLQNRQIGRGFRPQMLLDNIFDSHADYWLEDGQGHTQNKTVHTPMYFSTPAIKRDENLGSNSRTHKYAGAEIDERDDAYENALGQNWGDINWFRTSIDSIQTIISGRENDNAIAMPFYPVNDGIEFSSNLAQSLGILSSLSTVVITTGDGPYKSYAHVDATAVDSEARDELLKVSYELCRENFTSVFVDPQSPYEKSNWGSLDSCYPYRPVPAGDDPSYCPVDEDRPGALGSGEDEYYYTDEVRYNGREYGYCECDTWDRDASLPGVPYTNSYTHHISRTCRIESCYRITYKEVCDCEVSGLAGDQSNPDEVNCRIERATEPCDANDRLLCAASQVSCTNRVGSTVKFTRDCAIRNTTKYIDEPELEADLRARFPAICGQCVDPVYDYILGKYYCQNDAESSPGYLWTSACRMGVADHYICPAELELGIMDGKIYQNLPFNAADSSQQKNTDQVNVRQHILDQSLQPPYEPKNGMYSASHSDWENTNAMNPARVMTWGNVYVNTGGSEGNTAQLAARAMSPFPTDDVTTPINPVVNELEVPIVYHVEDPGFKIRSIDSVQPIMSPNRVKTDEAGATTRFDGSLQLAPGAITNSEVLNIFGTRGGKQLTSFSENYSEYYPPPVNHYSPCDISFCSDPSVPAFSNTALNIINYSASRFKIPPALLVAYMAVEGEAFNPPFYYGEGGYNAYMDDHLMDMWSKEYFGRIELIDDKNICSDTPWSSVGPGQWIKKWFTLFLHDDIACAELNRISPRRCNNASRCNFLDLLVVAAAHLDIRDGGPANCKGWNDSHIRAALGAISGKSYTGGQYGSALSIYKSCK